MYVGVFHTTHAYRILYELTHMHRMWDAHVHKFRRMRAVLDRLARGLKLALLRVRRQAACREGLLVVRVLMRYCRQGICPLGLYGLDMQKNDAPFILA